MARDRHGRAARADTDGRRRPSDGFRALGPVRFDRLVAEAVRSLPQRFAAPLAGARIVVADIPPPPMVDDEGEVVLAHFAPRVLTVYRRPLELRASSRATLEETLLFAVAHAVARALGFEGDLDDYFD